MSLEGELYSRATTHGDLSALIGGRFEYLRIPDGPTYPVCSYRRVTQSEPARASGTDGVLRQVTIQIDGWSRDPGEARDLRDAIFSAFNRWAADGSAAGTVVQHSFHDNTVDQYEDDTGVYHTSLDFRVYYEE